MQDLREGGREGGGREGREGGGGRGRGGREGREGGKEGQCVCIMILT